MPQFKAPFVLKTWVGYSFSRQQLGPLKSLRPHICIPSSESRLFIVPTQWNSRVTSSQQNIMVSYYKTKPSPR